MSSISGTGSTTSSFTSTVTGSSTTGATTTGAANISGTGILSDKKFKESRTVFFVHCEG